MAKETENKSAEEILDKWLAQCFEPTTLHYDTIGKLKEAMHEYAQQAVRSEQENHLEQMKLCFEQSRLTHPMAGFKYDTFEDFMESEILKQLK